jgi:hypothetical protein
MENFQKTIFQINLQFSVSTHIIHCWNEEQNTPSFLDVNLTKNDGKLNFYIIVTILTNYCTFSTTDFIQKNTKWRPSIQYCIDLSTYHSKMMNTKKELSYIINTALKIIQHALCSRQAVMKRYSSTGLNQILVVVPHK